jgi:hypothetical protein
MPREPVARATFSCMTNLLMAGADVNGCAAV